MPTFADEDEGEGPLPHRVRCYLFPWAYADPKARFFIEAIRSDPAVEEFSFEERATDGFIQMTLTLVEGARGLQNRGLEGQAAPFDVLYSARQGDSWAHKAEKPTQWDRLLSEDFGD